MIRSSDEERHRVDDALMRVLTAAKLIPIEPGTIQIIRQCRTLDLSPQDLLVYAAIRGHLEQVGAAKGAEIHGFVTRNSRDFGVPDVREGLAILSCRLFTSFRDALGFARSRP